MHRKQGVAMPMMGCSALFPHILQWMTTTRKAHSAFSRYRDSILCPFGVLRVVLGMPGASDKTAPLQELPCAELL